jgi:hypothetical protein
VSKKDPLFLPPRDTLKRAKGGIPRTDAPLDFVFKYGNLLLPPSSGGTNHPRKEDLNHGRS